MPPGHRSPRTAHVARTRRALVDAALKLFASQGYDATTTEEIAEAAGVSPRTFFRYFPTKESVLLFGESHFIRSFTGVYLAQPETMTEVAAMCASFVTLAPGVARLRGRIKLYRQAVASSLTLRGRESASHAENTKIVVQAIAERRGLVSPDAGCELLAAMGLAVIEHAMDRWLYGQAHVDLGEVIEATFSDLVMLVCPNTR